MLAFSPSTAEAALPRQSSPSAEFALFRPHLFFYRAWEGRGETLAPNGKRLATFTVRGDGKASSRLGRIVQHWTFDNGFAHTAEWKVLSTNGSDYRAIEANTGVLARGRQAGESFIWSMKVKAPTPFGVRNVRTTTVYRLLAPGVAEAHSTTTLFGIIPINRSLAIYRRLDAPAPH